MEEVVIEIFCVGIISGLLYGRDPEPVVSVLSNRFHYGVYLLRVRDDFLKTHNITVLDLRLL